MTRITIISAVIVGGAFAFGSSEIMAQTFTAEYTCEWQTDFKGGYDWLNLLQTSSELPLCEALTVEASTISTAKSGELTLLDDLLTYSNIEAGNIPLTLARLGLNMSVGEAQVFIGINNVNEDYFTSELTSFFTNSSCGISPTISCNYDIANYPMASWCVHYSQRSGPISWQTSLYPGRGYSRILGHDNLFGLNIKDDGIFSISSIDYNKNGIYTILGVALYHGVCMGDADGEPTEAPTSAAKKRFSATSWILSEISISQRLGVLAHGSISTVHSGCKGYAGLGLVYSGRRMQHGVSVNYASFTHTHEYDVELSTRLPLVAEKVHLQPTIHIVGGGYCSTQCIGMIRFRVEI